MLSYYGPRSGTDLQYLRVARFWGSTAGEVISEAFLQWASHAPQTAVERLLGDVRSAA